MFLASIWNLFFRDRDKEVRTREYLRSKSANSEDAKKAAMRKKRKNK